MRQTAHAVESRHPLDASLHQAPAAAARPDRLLLVIGPDPASAALIRRGRRVADYLRADCLAVYVSSDATLQHLTAQERDDLQRQLNFARGLHIDTRILEGDDVAEAVVAFAHAEGVTQIFIARQPESGWRSRLGLGLVQRLVNLARDIQVTVVADRSIRK